jgi:cellulose synthase/poly-beta-1,6-N-acetylglucosamine synthase-like glycosyltransferase
VTTAHSVLFGLILISGIWSAYTFLLYPAALRLLARFRHSRQPPPARDAHADELPRVALVISAYNEQAVIRAKLENSISIDYPAARLGIWVSSDGSSDATCAIVREFARAHARVGLMAHAVNRGKTAALLETVRALPESIDVVVFSDANSMYRTDAIRRLVSHFADPEVGCVAGELRYRTRSGEGAYRSYENRIKRAQSQLGVPVVAEGSIFAIRRSLMPDLPSDSLEDMVIPLRIASAGYRVVYEPEAVSEEVFALSLAAQWKRRRRIVNRALRALASIPEARNPFRGGWTAFHFCSHRLMRWFSPFFLLAGWTSLLTLGFTDATASAAARVLAGGTAVAVLLGAVMEWRGSGPRIIRLVGAFAISNSAILAGALSVLFRVKVVRWSPERS